MQLPQDSAQQSEVHPAMAADAAPSVGAQVCLLSMACLDCWVAPAYCAIHERDLPSQQLFAELGFCDSSCQLQQHLKGWPAACPALLVNNLKGLQNLYRWWDEAGAGVGCEAASQGCPVVTPYQMLDLQTKPALPPTHSQLWAESCWAMH